MKLLEWVNRLGWRVRLFKVLYNIEKHTIKDAAEIADNATYEDWLIIKATYGL